MRPSMKEVSVSAVLCLVASLATPARAAVQQIYTNKANFLAAIAGQTQITENFETAPLGLVPGPGIPLTHFDLVPLYANTNYLWIDSGAGSLNVDGTRYVWADVRRPAATQFEFEITFNQPVYAFGADFQNAYSQAGVLIRDQVNDVLVDFTQDWSVIGTGFFGFTLAAPVTAIRFAAAGGAGGPVENFGMDNVVLAVPEPATLVALAAVCGLLYRRR